MHASVKEKGDREEEREQKEEPQENYKEDMFVTGI